jgi:hypothetical protein
VLDIGAQAASRQREEGTSFATSFTASTYLGDSVAMNGSTQSFVV